MSLDRLIEKQLSILVLYIVLFPFIVMRQLDIHVVKDPFVNQTHAMLPHLSKLLAHMKRFLSHGTDDLRRDHSLLWHYL